jgi:hypothetical protein
MSEAAKIRIATFNLESFGNARKESATFEERAAVLRPNSNVWHRNCGGSTWIVSLSSLAVSGNGGWQSS